MIGRFATSVAVVLACCAIWQAIFMTRLVSPATLASPLEVLNAIPLFMSSNGFLEDVKMTVWRSLLAFGLSVPIGLVVGAVLFYSGYLKRPGEAIVDFLRSIPATALVPIFLLVFGIGDAPKIAAGVFSSSLVICLSVLLGLKNRNITRLSVTMMLGMSITKRFLYLDVPESLSQIFVGLRAGVSLALILVVVGEMSIGANHGLGRVINDLRGSDQIPAVYCALLLLGIIGYVYNKGIIWVESLVMHWQGNS